MRAPGIELTVAYAAAVDQHHRAAGRLDDGGVSLANIQERHCQIACAWRRARSRAPRLPNATQRGARAPPAASRRRAGPARDRRDEREGTRPRSAPRSRASSAPGTARAGRGRGRRPRSPAPPVRKARRRRGAASPSGHQSAPAAAPREAERARPPARPSAPAPGCRAARAARPRRSGARPAARSPPWPRSSRRTKRHSQASARRRAAPPAAAGGADDRARPARCRPRTRATAAATRRRAPAGRAPAAPAPPRRWPARRPRAGRPGSAPMPIDSISAERRVAIASPVTSAKNAIAGRPRRRRPRADRRRAASRGTRAAAARTSEEQQRRHGRQVQPGDRQHVRRAGDAEAFLDVGADAAPIAEHGGLEERRRVAGAARDRSRRAARGGRGRRSAGGRRRSARRRAFDRRRRQGRPPARRYRRRAAPAAGSGSPGLRVPRSSCRRARQAIALARAEVGPARRDGQRQRSVRGMPRSRVSATTRRAPAPVSSGPRSTVASIRKWLVGCERRVQGRIEQGGRARARPDGETGRQPDEEPDGWPPAAPPPAAPPPDEGGHGGCHEREGDGDRDRASARSSDRPGFAGGKGEAPSDEPHGPCSERPPAGCGGLFTQPVPLGARRAVRPCRRSA